MVKKNKSLMKEAITGIGFAVCVFLFLKHFVLFDCNDYLEERVVPLSVCGLVSQKYNDKNNFNSTSLFYLEDNEEIYFPTDVSYALHFWNAIEVGDSIFKEAGSDTVIVKHHKNNSYVIYKLECRFGKKYRNKD